MVPIRGEWKSFSDLDEQLHFFRAWGLIPPKSNKLRPIMVVDGYFGYPEPCKVVGYQGNSWAVIELEDGFHAIHGEYLAEMQPSAYQSLPHGVCFAQILSEYVVTDIETTGFSCHDDRIIEIAAIRYRYGKKISEYHTLVNPGIEIPSDITNLTGITQTDVECAPILDAVISSFLDFLGDSPIVGHNAASFDIPFLSSQMRCDLSNPVIDTLPMARRVFPLLHTHKLSYLNDILGLGSAGSHRALNDVETTNSLLWACLAPRKFESHINRQYVDHKMHSKPIPAKTIERPKTSETSRSRQNTYHNFRKVDIKSITPSCAVTAESPLFGKSIVFTGTLAIDREVAMQMAVNAGAVLKSAVSGKTAYLVVGKQDLTIVGTDGMSSKEEKAHALNSSGKANIEIISEAEFLNLVRKESVPHD